MADSFRRTASGLSPPFAALGVWETLYDYRVTELYSLIAATAAARLVLAPRVARLDARAFMSMDTTAATKSPRKRSST